MVDVRVGEHHSVQGCRVHGQRTPVAAPQLFESLKLSTINEKPVVIDLEQVLGAGHRPCRTKKREPSHQWKPTRISNMTCAAFPFCGVPDARRVARWGAFTLLLTATFVSFASA